MAKSKTIYVRVIDSIEEHPDSSLQRLEQLLLESPVPATNQPPQRHDRGGYWFHLESAPKESIEAAFKFFLEHGFRPCI
ncbi:MAG: hypothetical protein AAFQ82_08940 [Myxococcota bacterium]